ncbi:hydrogen gas-evolving membrane-bound hydrogenase subunit E [Candidatus Margulisiibacteriota bacterium]
MIELNLLLVFMIIGAVVAVENRNILSSIIAVGAVGFGLAIVFLLLGAPDLAIVQVVVEILALIILIRATLNKSVPEDYKGRAPLTYLVTLVFMAAILGVSFYAFKALPEFGSPIMKVAQYYLAQGVAKTGAVNLVTSVILDFRAYDTLGEATVLFTAIVGAFAVLRLKGKKKVEEEEVDEE